MNSGLGSLGEATRWFASVAVVLLCAMALRGGDTVAQDRPVARGAPRASTLAVACAEDLRVRVSQQPVPARRGFITALGDTPAAAIPGNVAFFATARGDRRSDEMLLWAAYDSWIESHLPHPIWSAGIAFDPHRKKIMLAFVRTEGTKLQVSVFAIDPEGPVGRVPERLDPEKPDRWPKPTAAVATLKTWASPARSGAVVRTVVVPERNALVLALERRDASAPSLYLRFAWGTKTWTWVQLVEEPVDR